LNGLDSKSLFSSVSEAGIAGDQMLPVWTTLLSGLESQDPQADSVSTRLAGEDGSERQYTGLQSWQRETGQGRIGDASQGEGMGVATGIGDIVTATGFCQKLEVVPLMVLSLHILLEAAW
jgi:hypothetical protein